MTIPHSHLRIFERIQIIEQEIAWIENGLSVCDWDYYLRKAKRLDMESMQRELRRLEEHIAKN